MMHSMHKIMHNLHEYSVVMQKYAQLCTLCTGIEFKPAARIGTQVIAGEPLAAMAGH